MTPGEPSDPAELTDPVDGGSTGTEASGTTDAGTETTAVPEGADTSSEPEWVRRRRLDAVFGDGAHGQALGDGYYRDQVPPHHG